MSRPLARFTASRIYISLTLFAIGGAALSAWNALHWAPSWIAAALFALSGLLLAAITIRPVIEIYESHLVIGRRLIPWRNVRRVDHTGWNTPLVVILTLLDRQRIHILHPGDVDSSSSLLRHIRRLSQEALLDGVPYRNFWAEVSGTTRSLESAAEPSPSPEPDPSLEYRSPARKNAQADAPVRYPLLRAEDEEEVERLFRRLKSVGHFESKSSDEK